MLPPNVLRYGSEEPLAERVRLRAGPLTMVFDRGEIRYIRYGDREVLRRVYMAVRDRNWGTAPNPIANLAIVKTADGFQISYDVVSRQGEIDFRWSAAISGDANGTVEWTMQGEAYSTFWRNRIGYCVLHPVRECAGQGCRIERPDGSIESGTFPNRVSPHQPFRDIRAMSHEVAPGVRAEVRFSGDIFETEDQRNWTDASFKTYSTPLDLPFPVEVQAGTVIRQSVRLSLCTSPVFSYAETDSVPVPEIGLGGGEKAKELGASRIARLRAMNLSHLRADLDLATDYSGALAAATGTARALGIPLELAIRFSAESQLGAFAARVRGTAVRVRRWLIFQHGAVEVARKHLAALAPEAGFFAGTDANFAELNRNRPDPATVDGVCFSLNPQVHAFDNDNIVENLPGQADAVESARALANSKPVAVTPVTLKPRFNAVATAPERAVEPGELPPDVDVRQMSLFGAAFTLGSLKYLAEAGAASVTFYETTGWRGVMDAGVFPLYHTLADAGEFAGGEILRSRSTRPLVVDGLVLRRGNRVRILLANMTNEDVKARVEGVGRNARVRRLDETNAVRAMADPESFRAEAGEPLQSGGGELELSLMPYATLCIDFERSSG